MKNAGNRSLMRALAAVAAILMWPIAAYAIDVGDTVRIAVGEGVRVNVRSQPEVRNGNIIGKALGNQRAAVVEARDQGTHVWYRLRAPDWDFEGWIRGDLLARDEAAQVTSPPAATATQPAGPNRSAAEAAPGGQPATQSQASAQRVARPPLEQRRDWTRNLPGNISALRSCIGTGSAQPATALDLEELPRNLVKIVIKDRADRQWNCTVRSSGGTPLRFDPMFTGSLTTTTGQPVFHAGDSPKPAGSACEEVETIAEAQTGKALGWLVYDICDQRLAQ